MANKEILITNRDNAKKIVDASLVSVKKALEEKDLTKYNLAMEKLKKELDDYNQMVRKVEYATLLENEHPVIAAVKKFYIEIEKPKEKKDDGVVIDVELEKKKSRIDLEAFCKFGEISTKWADNSARLLELLALREVDVFNLKASDLLARSFYFVQQARAKQSGATPDSNTQIVKMLQAIIDDAIFIDDGSGHNVYKCTNHDLAFIHDAITKMDMKAKCTIATMNARQFKTVMMSVFAHCLGEVYKVKVAKTKTPAAE